MKKILIGLAVVVAIIAVAMTMFAGKLDGLIADAIETEGTAAIGTSVTVDSVETKLADGIAIVKGLAIANPDGYKADKALVIETFSAKVDYQTQIIEEVLINKPIINAELTGTKSNFDALLEGMPESEGEIIAEGESDDNEDLVLTINSLQLLQATVNIDSDKLGQTSFVMADFVMNNLSGTVDELSDQVTTKLVNHITNEIKVFAETQIAVLLSSAAAVKVEEKLNEEVNKKINEKLGSKLGDKIKLKKFKFKKD